jgi:hypothetical protein
METVCRGRLFFHDKVHDAAGIVRNVSRKYLIYRRQITLFFWYIKTIK